jgi:hypothetical protein
MRAAVLFLFLLGPAAAASAAPSVVATPERVVLGSDQTVQLRIQGLPPGATLRAVASSGQLTPLPPDGEDRLFGWTPPDIRYPTWAVLLFWDAAAPDPDVGVLRLPLLGRTELEMTTERLAEVRVEVGGRAFGPVTANERGRVKVPIEVPPGVRTAEVFATAAGRQTRRSVALEVPDTAPLAVALGPDPMPPSGGWLFAGTAGDATGLPQVTARSARLEGPARDGAELTFRVQPEPGADEVEVAVGRPGSPAQRAKVAVGEGERVGTPAPSSAGGDTRAVLVHALGGGYLAGGANRGLAFEMGGGYRLPVLDDRLFAEASVGLRTGALEATLPLGSARSGLTAFPLVLSARYLLLARGPLAVSARAGGGVVPFRHRLRSSFGSDVSGGGTGFEFFGAVQGQYRLGPVDLVAELRGALAQARSRHLDARPGGLNLVLGARWSPR